MRIQQFGSLKLKHLLPLTLAALLTACGGGDGTALDNATGGGGGGTGGGDDGGDDTNDFAQIGHGSGDSFAAGEIGTEIADGNSLSAGGSALLNVNVVSGGELVTDQLGVTFNSPCFASGEAIFTPQNVTPGEGNNANTVQTTNGQATIRYTANGCVGDDTIQAATSFGGENISASTTINVAADTTRGINFVDATPNYITLQGTTGGTETSEVRFRVLGETGAPIKDVQVSFSITTKEGGPTLVNDSDVSGADGYVSTTVQSGTVPTSVSVTATTEGGITNQSSELVVSTGLPDQNSMSISASKITPIAWNHNNVESQITVNVADAFNNPAPEGTAIYFTTNGGGIGASCLTGAIDSDQAGKCTVTWNSQNPRPTQDSSLIVTDDPPATHDYDADRPTISCPPGVAECHDGRLKILASTVGNESFIDTDSNGLYDPGADTFYSANSEGGDTARRAQNCRASQPVSGLESPVDPANPGQSEAYGCDDLGDPYLDRNFNRQYDTGEEIATVGGEGNDNEYNQPDGVYNGSLCRQEDADAGLCTRGAKLVRADMTLVMSCDTSPLTTDDGRLPGLPNHITIPQGSSADITVLAADCNGNGLPGGTEVSANTDLTDGLEAEVFPNGELTTSTEPGTLLLNIIADDQDPASGTVFIELEIPGPNDGSSRYGFGVGVSNPPSDEEDSGS